jgi:hypothetical protein
MYLATVKPGLVPRTRCAPCSMSGLAQLASDPRVYLKDLSMGGMSTYGLGEPQSASLPRPASSICAMWNVTDAHRLKKRPGLVLLRCRDEWWRSREWLLQQRRKPRSQSVWG